MNASNVIAIFIAILSATFAFVPGHHTLGNKRTMGTVDSIASKVMVRAKRDVLMASIVELDERHQGIQWNPYVPTVSEHVLFLYHSVTKTMTWAIRRLPFDLKVLVRCTTRGPLLMLGLLLAKLTKLRSLQVAVLLWVLREVIVRILKGLFYPICAGYALGYTWRMKLAYFHCACPWWLVNKLSEFRNNGGDIEFLCELCQERRVHDEIRAHIEARRVRPGDIPNDGGDPSPADLEDTIKLMSDWGGSFVTQLYLFGTRHVFRNEHEHWMHLMVSCVAHLVTSTFSITIPWPVLSQSRTGLRACMKFASTIDTIQQCCVSLMVHAL